MSFSLPRRSLGVDPAPTSYIQSFEASTALIIASMGCISVVWWLMQGDLSRFPRIKARVMAQTQIRPEDEIDGSMRRGINEKAVV